VVSITVIIPAVLFTLDKTIKAKAGIPTIH